VKDSKEERVVVSKLFPTTHFGFRKITVERPLRLNFQASPERIARLETERAFQALAQSKKKGSAGAKEQADGRAEQVAILRLVGTLPDVLFKDRDKFEHAVDAAARKAAVKLSAPVSKAILSALSERDETAAICCDTAGNPEPDPELRDTESVPLSESVEAFFDREVKPHVPDAWIDMNKRDPRDGDIGIVGYEINFNRYFYCYTPPRPLEAIDADIRGIEADIVRMLGEVTGTRIPPPLVMPICRHLLVSADVYGYRLLVSSDEKAAVPDIFRLRDIDGIGLTRGRLSGLISRGEAEKVARGLYRRPSEITELDTVATVCARVPDGIICLLTALLIHRIGTQLPADVWVGIDRTARKPKLGDLPVRIVRFSGPMLHYGIEERRVQGVIVRLTSPARTVIDCFRYRNKIGIDVALEALKDSLRTSRVSVGALVRAAQVCRVHSVIKPYLEAIVA
jgi:putative AbiEi antitoxin of type IV toxin-antitoxin system